MNGSGASTSTSSGLALTIFIGFGPSGSRLHFTTSPLAFASCSICIWRCFAASFAAISALEIRCVSTPGGNKVGVPGVRDKIVSRYERPLDQILNSAREVLSRTGTVTNDDVVTNTLTARIDKRTVYVTVKEVEPLVTEVTVQVRTSRGTGDLTVASEIDKQIALGLVLPQN